ncbi:DMT family transporter [Streptomyces sp. NPDC092296]|uniref:DMT family transporter n=1 Tax=Streptomyces sp. NPDC092296 TaxID=3366012 RepID=UPI0037FFD642
MLYTYALIAACLIGLGFVLQQHAAEQAPQADMLSYRLLLDLVRIPVWLWGMGCMVAGQIFSVLALARGDLSHVEPLLATNLLFAMALARWRGGQRLGLSGWTGVLLLSGGVAAFIVAGRPEGGSAAEISALRHWLVFGSVVGAALVLVAVARHLQIVKEPPLLAAAAGLLYGLQDALTRTSSGIWSDSGFTGLVTSWEPYAIVAVAVTGLLLVQSAFEVGPLRMSLPALTAAEPLAGIACGIGFLGDRLRVTPAALAGQVIGLIAVVTGVFVLGRHPTMPTGSGGRGAAGGRPGRGRAELRE